MEERELKMRTRGFTLVEIMIVVLILGMLITIAIPQWVYARDKSRQRACVNNMRQIEQAKDQYALDARLPEGAAVASTDLGSYIKGPFPSCPSAGTYTLNGIGTSVVCSQNAGAFPHILGGP